MAKKFDPLSLAPFFYSLLPNDEEDDLTGGRGNDTFNGNAKNNLLVGLGGNDVLDGGEGNDILDGGEGVDTLMGGDGNDVFIVDNTRDLVSGGDGVDKVLASVSYVLASDVENLELTGSSNITGSGNALNNLITGNGAGNLLEGLAGNDTLLGLDGNDLLDGGTGIDSLIGGKGDDIYVVDQAADKIVENAGEGSDTVRSTSTYSISGLANVENIELTGSANINGTGNAVNNILTGNVGANVLSGDLGNDSLRGLEGNDTLSGGLGDDMLVGGEGNDFMDGGVGFDRVDFSSAPHAMAVDLSTYTATGQGSDTLRGIEAVFTGSGADKLIGDSLGNALRSGDGNDTLLGGAGDDTLDGGSGTDSIDGGAGQDAVDYSSSAAPVRISLLTPIQFGGQAQGDTLKGIEDVIGSAGNDTLVGNARANLIEGLAGADYLDGGAGNDDTLSYNLSVSGVRVNLAQASLHGFGDAQGDTISGFENLIGSSYADSLVGSSTANLLVGGNGADSIVGAEGADTLLGGAGNDTLVVDTSDNRIDGGDGVDAVIYSQSTDLGDSRYISIENIYLSGSALRATGNSAANLLVGNSLANTLTGNDGADTLDGGKGSDSLIGGAGDDFYIIDAAGDQIFESGSSHDEDTVFTDLANYSLASNLENLVYSGSYSAKLSGNLLPNQITGGKSNDSLVSGGGNDTLDGKLGADTLVGGSGDDVYYVDSYDDLVIEIGGGGNDTVYLAPDIDIASYANIETVISITPPPGGPINDSLVGTSRDDTLRGLEGNDTLRGQAGNDSLDGGVGADSIDGGLGNDRLDGGAGNDNLDGGLGTNTLVGGGGDDMLSSSFSSDSLVGGAGNDTYYVYGSGSQISESADQGTDLIVTDQVSVFIDFNAGRYVNVEKIEFSGNSTSSLGDSLDNTLLGGANADSLNGKAGNDTLLGLGGNDTLDGGSGSDSMLGGFGNDVYYVDNLADTVVESGNSGTDLVIASISYNLAENSANIENLTLDASLATADININATGNSVANFITGNAGNNILNGGGGSDTLVGGGGSDNLQGGQSDGVSDSLVGGSGNDLYTVDSISDIIFDSEGQDTIQSAISLDLTQGNISGAECLIYTGSEKATLVGDNKDNLILSQSALGDTLRGSAGNDTLNGGKGANSLIGGNGDDYYIVNTSNDIIYEDSSLGGFDTADVKISAPSVYYKLDADSKVEQVIFTGEGLVTLEGSNSDNSIVGGDLSNTLIGNAGNDYLVGGGLSDSLVGGAGADTLVGKGGADTLDGGDGNDVYLTSWQNIQVSELKDKGTDLIRSTVDFSLIYSPSFANIEKLYLAGNANLKGTGNSLNNSITGNDGSNTITAGEGNDTILGGLGADLLKGDLGNDSIMGGGDPQTDLPADASTPIFLQSGQTYSGFIESRQDTDWIKVKLLAGTTYKFDIDKTLFGPSALTMNSNIGFLVNGSVLNKNGSEAYGSFGSYIYTGNFFSSFTFTPFDTAEFYIPISGSGPALGSYRVTLTDPDNLSSSTPALADNASNTLVGGLGVDTLISGNGRDSLSNAIGDLLIGGTNGLAGMLDVDTSSDVLLGGDGADTLDGGGGADSMLGGVGNDVYYINDVSDQAIEDLNGGAADKIILNIKQSGGLFDVDLGLDFANIEQIEMLGLANLSARGNRDDNSISGNSGNNVLDGGEGDDTLLGGGGNDSLLGSDGGDSLYGGTGINTLVGGLGSDTYLVDRNTDRIREEQQGLDGGNDLVRTRINFDPLQADAFSKYFSPTLPDGSPAKNKSLSFASRDVEVFYNLENFELLGAASYGVGNALDNEITISSERAYVLGQGGSDEINGGAGDDSLFGESDANYATPDLYAAVPFDTRTQDFVDNVVGEAGNDTLLGGDGNDWLDGGASYDTMIGGAGNDTYIINNTNDYIDNAGGGSDQVYSSVNLPKMANGISRLNLVIAKQPVGSGQNEVASFASFAETAPSYTSSTFLAYGRWSKDLTNIASMEASYGVSDGRVFLQGAPTLALNVKYDADSQSPFKKMAELTWNADSLGDPEDTVLGYVIEYRQKIANMPWLTYMDGKSQDFSGTVKNPKFIIKNLDASKEYEFKVRTQELTLPTAQAPDDSLFHQVVTLEGGTGADLLSATRLAEPVSGGLLYDTYLNPFVLNNPIAPIDPGTILTPESYEPSLHSTHEFVAYLNGLAGNDVLIGARVNDAKGEDYTLRGVSFQGLNTLVGGQGSDTFVVMNGGQTMGGVFDRVIKYGAETPVTTESGVGASLNGGKHNLVVSALPFTTLSDEDVSQGKFIDQLTITSESCFGRGNRLDNYINGLEDFNTLVGAMGRDSIVGDTASDYNILIGGTAYGIDNVGLAIEATNGKSIRANTSFTLIDNALQGSDSLDIASTAGLFEGQLIQGPDIAPDTMITSILGSSIQLSRPILSSLSAGTALSTDNKATYQRYRDTDPVPPNLAVAGTADNSKYWFIEAPKGSVYDPMRNSDTLVAGKGGWGCTLDGGAGRDSLIGSTTSAKDPGDTFYVSASGDSFDTGNSLYGGNIFGGIFSHDIKNGDAVIGNGGNDTIVFTDSDNYWSGKAGATTAIHGYTIQRYPNDSDISNLVLAQGSPTARIALGNFDSTGVADQQGSNCLVGNEFNNTLDGGGVGGLQGKDIGFDTLTGGGGQDLFIVEGYTESTSNKWDVKAELVKEGTSAGKYKYSSKDSIYTDKDFVVITDFQNQDKIRLGGSVSSYWIGAAPSGAKDNNVKPSAPSTTEFGIYLKGSPGGAGPNLVASVRTEGFALTSNDIGAGNLAFTPNLPDDNGNASQTYLGWGKFYNLDTSSIAGNIVTNL